MTVACDPKLRLTLEKRMNMEAEQIACVWCRARVLPRCEAREELTW
jgi:hypothetical protein